VAARVPGTPMTAGVAWGGVGVLCFSGTAPATRVAAPAFGPETLTFARIVIAALLAAGALTLMRDTARPARADLPALARMGLGLAVGFPLLLAVAVERVPAAHGAVVVGLVPAATAMLSVLLTGERPPPLFWIGCAAGLAAVVSFAISQGGGSLRSADLWLLAAVASCAVGYVEGGRLAHRIGAVPSLCWAVILLAPAALIGLTISISSRSFEHLDAGAWTGLVYAGVTSMFLGSIAWYRGLAAGGIARIGQLNLLQPLLAIAWSALLLKEHIGAAVPLTALAVLASMTLCVKARDPAADPDRRHTTPGSDEAARSPRTPLDGGHDRHR
jgi:drug/metabolite transporter (DMT)-like permease